MSKIEKFLQYWLFPVLILVVAWIVSHALGKALYSMIAALFMAYLFFPVIHYLETKKIHRTVSVSAIFFIILIFLTLFILFIFPLLLDESSRLILALPSYLMSLIDHVNVLLHKYHLDVSIQKSSFEKIISEFNLDFGSKFFNSLSDVSNRVLSGFQEALDVFLSLFLMPIFFFYLVSNFERVSVSIHDIIPPRYRSKVEGLFLKSDKVLSGFIRGQIMVCVILAGYYSILLSVVGLPFGVLIGFLSGILSFIPYVGFTSGFMVSLLIAFFQGETWTLFFLVLGVFLFAQVFESFYLTPKIVGDKVGLTPFETILAIIIMSNLMGFFGVVVAVPIAGILKYMAAEFLESYKKSDFYLEKRTLGL